MAAVVAGLLPYLVGLGLSAGARDAADAAVRDGADLYISGEELGRPAPVDIGLADEIGNTPGVERAVPRIVGRIDLGTERVSAVVVGLPAGQFPARADLVDGRLCSAGPRNELVVGSDLARRLNLKVGSLLPPFYHSRDGERVSEVVGIFRPDVAPWQARLILATLETAARIFDRPRLATDVAVYCRPGYAENVRAALRARPGNGRRLRIVTRSDLLDVLPEGARRREGAHTGLYVVVFAVTILVILATAGTGLAERRREVGILKATGWQTDELLVRSLAESLVLAAIAGSVAVVAAVVWLKGFNGYGIAGVFLPGVDVDPGYRVPFRLLPTPVLTAVLVAVAVVCAGSLHPTWRAATAPPAEAVR